MLFRDGSLSTFPHAVDTFTAVSSGSLELAIHFNHLFDACLNVEKFLVGSIGGPVQSRYSAEYRGDIAAGENLLVGGDVFVEYASGSVTFTGEVPGIFGAEPFDSPGFCMLVSPYYRREEDVFGFGRNLPSGGETWNMLIRTPVVYTSVEPVSGSTYRLHAIVQNFMETTPGMFTDNFNRPDSFSLGPYWMESELKPGSIRIGSHRSSDRNRCTIWSRERTDPQTPQAGGWAIPAVMTPSTDHFVQFKYVERVNDAGPSDTSRAGMMIRATGAPTSGSCYAFIIGWDGNGTSARLMKFLNQDFITNNIAVTGVTLASGISVSTNNYYRLEAEGTTIRLKHSTDGNNWTLVTSVTDTSLTSGRPGLVGIKRTGNGTMRGFLVIDDFGAGYISPPSYELRVRVLYVKVGPNSKILMGRP